MAEKTQPKPKGGHKEAAKTGSIEQPIRTSTLDLSKYSGRQKAAILIVALGPDHSAELFQYLTDVEIEEITLEIANLHKVTPEEKYAVIEDFYQMALAKEYIAQGGIDFAREVLEKALGAGKAMDVINRLSSFLEVTPFDFARKTDPAQLLNFIQNEHPQTIALILAYLEPQQAAQILSGLEPEQQMEVAKRMAIMDRTAPEVIREVERVLEKKLSTVLSQEYAKAGGVASLVELLNRVDRSTEKAIIERLEEEDPELAEEVRRMLFVFEDIIMLDDRSIQLILKEVDKSELAMALKGTSEDVANKVYKNMSKRAGEMLKEEIDYMGPVRLRDVEESQQRIVATIRRLEDAGEIVVARGGEDEVVA